MAPPIRYMAPTGNDDTSPPSAPLLQLDDLTDPEARAVALEMLAADLERQLAEVREDLADALRQLAAYRADALRALR